MMINLNYNEIITQAKTQAVSQVDFNNNKNVSSDNSAYKDTLTLSNQALSLLKGENSVVQAISPIYVKPHTAAELLAENRHSDVTQSSKSQSVDDVQLENHTVKDSRFGDMMQAILDKRLGVDRKKLEELDAMMEKIAKDEKLSPEAKAKAMEAIEKMREKVIEDSIEVKEIAKDTFPEDGKVDEYLLT